MSDIVRLGALPDEMLSGLIGRISTLNGGEATSQTLAGLRSALGLPESAYAPQIVGAYLGCTPLQVVRRHTLQPVHRAFSIHVGTLHESRILSGASSPTRTYNRVEHEAMACWSCCAEDQEAGRTGPWRRIHHLPHVDWCVVHRTPLRKFKPKAFGVSPLAASSSMTAETCSEPTDVGPGSALARYAELMSRWLVRRATAMPYEALNRVAKDGCSAHGLRVGQTGKRELVSDRARQCLPADWLARHWPDLLTKSPGQYIARFDGVAKDRHVAYPSPTCALVLAVLFESVDDIEARLKAAQLEIQRTAREHDATVHAAIGDFKGGASLRQASRTHGVAVGNLERWLRDLAQGVDTKSPSTASL